MSEAERRAAELAALAERHPEWIITRTTAGLLAATRKDDPGVTVQGEDAVDLRDQIIAWEWRHAAG